MTPERVAGALAVPAVDRVRRDADARDQHADQAPGVGTGSSIIAEAEM